MLVNIAQITEILNEAVKQNRYDPKEIKKFEQAKLAIKCCVSVDGKNIDIPYEVFKVITDHKFRYLL